MKEKELVALCRAWQEILKISDWDVEIKFDKPRDMPDGIIGLCRPMTTQKYARVSILHPTDMDPSEDFETVLVHELLHIVFHGELIGIPRKGVESVLFEQAIQATAEALVRGYRDE